MAPLETLRSAGFLEQIYHNAKQGQKPVRVDSRSYIDAVGYWKARHAEAEDNVTALKQRLLQLESKLAYKNNPGDNFDAAQDTPNRANSQRKRKAGNEIFHPCLQETKKRCSLGLNVDRKQLQTCFETIEDQLLGPQGERATSASRRVTDGFVVTNYLETSYSLQRILTQSNPTLKDLIVTIDQLCSDVASLIRQQGLSQMDLRQPKNAFKTSQHITRTEGQRRAQTKRKQEIHLDLIRQSLVLLADALVACISDTRLGSDEGRVVHAVSGLFNTILEQIHQLSAVPSKPIVVREEANRGRGRAKMPPIPNIASIDPDGACISLAQLGVWIFASLDLANRTQHRISEGCLFYLLERTGHMLQYFTFGTDGFERQDSCANAESHQGFHESEAPYLVWILERVMPIVGNSDASKTGERDANYTEQLNEGHDILKSRLPRIAKDRLQKTLLKAVFDDDTITFEERLFKPICPTPERSSAPQIGNHDMAAWFKSKIWVMLGWDMLRQHIRL